MLEGAYARCGSFYGYKPIPARKTRELKRPPEKDIPGIRVVRDKSGKIVGLSNVQYHHIISDKHVRTRKHDLWILAEMHPDDKFNKMLLPTKTGAMKGTNKRSVHDGKHASDVNNVLAEKMDDILKKGEIQGWRQPQYQEALKDIIRQEYEFLKSGERKLNTHHR